MHLLKAANHIQALMFLRRFPVLNHFPIAAIQVQSQAKDTIHVSLYPDYNQLTQLFGRL